MGRNEGEFVRRHLNSSFFKPSKNLHFTDLKFVRIYWKHRSISINDPPYSTRESFPVQPILLTSQKRKYLEHMSVFMYPSSIFFNAL